MFGNRVVKMADEPESLVLRYLRRIDEKVDRLGNDMIDVKERLSAVELGLAGVRREIAGLAERTPA